MNQEKEQENAIAMTHYMNEIVQGSVPQLSATKKVIDSYFANPNEENEKAVRGCSENIKELWRVVSEYTSALSDFKARMEFAIVDIFNRSPELQKEFKIQEGAKSTKCKPEEMATLIRRCIDSGIVPEAFASACSPLTAKKAADLFGLSQQAFLEAHGDLMETKQNKPSVKGL